MANFLLGATIKILDNVGKVQSLVIYLFFEIVIEEKISEETLI